MSIAAPDPIDEHVPAFAPASAGTRDLKRLVLRLWVLCLLAVTHGSLYPWTFAATASTSRGWSRLWSPSSWWTGAGDLLGNILLFLPLGALSWLLVQPLLRQPAGKAFAILVLGGLFAFVLQVLQMWLPTRSPAMSDVIWNLVGLGLGMPLARLVPPPLIGLSRLWALPHRVGLTMACLWLVIAWWPLLPGLSRVQVRNALRQLNHVADVDWLSALPPALGAMLVLHLVRQAPWRAAVAVLLPLLALLGQFVFIHPLHWSAQVQGWLAGVVLGAWSWRWADSVSTRAMMAASLLALLAGALLPWQWSAVAQDFHWVPLHVALGSQRVLHTLALLWVMFWVLALLVLAWRMGLPTAPTVAVVSVLLLALEWLQRWMPLQQADITPVLLPLLCWTVLHGLVQRSAPTLKPTGP